MTTTKDWFSVDKKGLAQVLERKGKSFAVLELLSNAWDQTVTCVDVTLTPADKRARYELVVVDDDPDGFSDITHAFTLFAPSTKKDKAEVRGRFNLGEKLVLALCDEAVITSTTGAVRFDDKGRHSIRERRAAGSEFRAVLPMTKAEFEEVCRVVRTVIPPVDGTTTFNGEAIKIRTPVHIFRETLPTVLSDEDGNLRNTARKTNIALYEPEPGETAMIYEMGIPVVENGDRFHCDIGQKVPLSLERDAVTPAYLRQLRTFVLNQTFSMITVDDANSTWTKEAVEDPRVSEEAVRTWVEKKYGDKVVAFDPSDQEANRIATAQGYTVIGGRSLSKPAWDNIRQYDDLIPAAGKVTPSGTALLNLQLAEKDEGRDSEVPEEKWTDAQRRVAIYSHVVADHLLGHEIGVRIVSDITLYADAFYSRGIGWPVLSFNVGKLGHRFFNDMNQEEVDALLIHELAHDRVSNHLSEEFHDECCRLGAKMRTLKSTLENV